MTIAFENKKPKDLTRVDTKDLNELLWWSYYFGTSPEKILSLIVKTGNAVSDIKKELLSTLPQ